MSETEPAAAASFDSIFREREVFVLRTAYRILGNWADAEDVSQDVFIRLHKHRAEFGSDAALRSWLYRVTVNLCLDRARSARPVEELAEVMSGDRGAHAALEVEQQREMLHKAIALLPPKERAALVLREIEGLPTAEVASILGSSEVTVRSQVARAVSHLRELLSNDRR